MIDHISLSVSDYEQTPAPGNLRGTLAAGGTLAEGERVYRVSASVPVAQLSRAYYEALRLMSYIYLVGGYTDVSLTDTVERHLQ